MIREIPNFEGYKISSNGIIYSCWYPVKYGRKKGVWKKLKPAKNRYGYLYVDLSSAQGIKRKTIHQLVATTFIENTNQLPIVRHIDSDPTNNNINNLAWGTVKENIHDQIKRGTHVGGWNKQQSI
jgi:hypothetical protein